MRMEMEPTARYFLLRHRMLNFEPVMYFRVAHTARFFEKLILLKNLTKTREIFKLGKINESIHEISKILNICMLWGVA